MAPYTKDPQAKNDYGYDWTKWLAGDTISSSTWASAPTGLTQSNPTASTTNTTVWLAGGTVDTVYRVTNHIVTAAGRENDETFRIIVREG